MPMENIERQNCLSDFSVDRPSSSEPLSDKLSAEPRGWQEVSRYKSLEWLQSGACNRRDSSFRHRLVASSLRALSFMVFRLSFRISISCATGSLTYLERSGHMVHRPERLARGLKGYIPSMTPSDFGGPRLLDSGESTTRNSSTSDSPADWPIPLVPEPLRAGRDPRRWPRPLPPPSSPRGEHAYLSTVTWKDSCLAWLSSPNRWPSACPNFPASGACVHLQRPCMLRVPPQLLERPWLREAMLGPSEDNIIVRPSSIIKVSAQTSRSVSSTILSCSGWWIPAARASLCPYRVTSAPGCQVLVFRGNFDRLAIQVVLLTVRPYSWSSLRLSHKNRERSDGNSPWFSQARKHEPHWKRNSWRLSERVVGSPRSDNGRLFWK